MFFYLNQIELSFKIISTRLFKISYVYTGGELITTTATRGLQTSINQNQQTLAVNPTLSHTNSQVEITGKGFQPGGPVTIEGSLICPDEDFNFQSYAHVYADDAGCLDMRKAKCVGGTYTGVDGMGLFWSMTKRESSRNYRCILGNGKIILFS